MPVFPNPEPRAAVRFLDDRNLVPQIGDAMYVPDTHADRAGWAVADGTEMSPAAVPEWVAKFGSPVLPDLAQYFAVEGYTVIVRVR